MTAVAKLGREAARDAWLQHGADLAALPRYPALSTWMWLRERLRAEGAEVDREAYHGFIDAYQSELRALAAIG